MVRVCAFPGCGKKMKKYNPESFHALPLRCKDRFILNQWLLVLKMDTDTPVETLRQMDHRICSAHFHEDDFSLPRRAADPNKPQRVHLKKHAVPKMDISAAAELAFADLKDLESTAIPQTPTLSSHLRKPSHKRKSSKRSVLTLAVSNSNQTSLPRTYIAQSPVWTQKEHTGSEMKSEMCIIQGCEGTEELLSFPTDTSTLQQWMLFLNGRLKHPVNSSSKVCSAHFTTDSLAYWQHKHYGGGGHLTLKTGVVCDGQVDSRASAGGRGDLQQTLVMEDTGVTRATPPYAHSKATQTTTATHISLGDGLDLLLQSTKAVNVETDHSSEVWTSDLESNRFPSHMQERDTLMSDVVVKLACLLQLFQRCLKCCSDSCSISTSRKGPILHVEQHCWSCGNNRKWTSQPPADQLHPDPTNSLTAKEEPEVPPEDVEEITIKLEEERLDIEDKGEEAGDEVEREKEKEEDETKKGEEEEENQKPVKRRRRDSDGEWASDDDDETTMVSMETMESSDEESEGEQEVEPDEVVGPNQCKWCCDCGEESRANCFKQKHLQFYCCVKCGFRDGHQEPRNLELQETKETDRPEIHQEGTGDVCQAGGHNNNKPTAPSEHTNNKPTQSRDHANNKPTASSEHTNNKPTQSSDHANNKPTASSDCPNDSESLSSQACQPGTHIGIEEPLDNRVDASTCTRDTWCIKEEPSESQPESNNNHQQETSATDEDKRNIPKYAIYFQDLCSLQSHMRRSHSGKRRLCPDCGVFSNSRNRKHSHVCKHKMKPFPCPSCERRFSSEARLQLHIQFHNEDYSTKCQYCYETFRRKEDKQQHEETHNGEKLKFRCPECPKRFAKKHTRKAHLSTAHFKGGRFVCKVCDKGFHFEFKLKRHEVVHSGIKPYRCELCDRSFNQPGHLKSHMRVHTGEKPFMCHECGLCFNHNVSLKNHVQRKHRLASASDGDNGYREEVWDDLITGTRSDGQKI